MSRLSSTIHEQLKVAQDVPFVTNPKLNGRI